MSNNIEVWSQIAKRNRGLASKPNVAPRRAKIKVARPHEETSEDNSDSTAILEPAAERIDIDRIRVDSRHRSVDEDFLQTLSTSMGQVGQLDSLHVIARHDGNFDLLSGRQRLAAAARLGWRFVNAKVRPETEIESRLIALALNLHRLELTRLQRADCEAEWIQLTREKVGQLAHPVGGTQPHEQGLSKSARDLKVTRRTLDRSRRIARIHSEARLEVVRLGLDNNEKALLEIAKEPTLRAQIARAKIWVQASQAGTRKSAPSVGESDIGPASPTTGLNTAANADDVDLPIGLVRDQAQALARLKTVWNSEGLRRMLMAVAKKTRRDFLQIIARDLEVGFPD